MAIFAFTLTGRIPLLWLQVKKKQNQGKVNILEMSNSDINYAYKLNPELSYFALKLYIKMVAPLDSNESKRGEHNNLFRHCYCG